MIAKLLVLFGTLFMVVCLVGIGVCYGVLWGMRIERRITRWRDEQLLKLQQERFARERQVWHDRDALVADLRDAANTIKLAAECGIEEGLFCEEEGEGDFELSARLVEHANRIDPQGRARA